MIDQRTSQKTTSNAGVTVEVTDRKARLPASLISAQEDYWIDSSGEYQESFSRVNFNPSTLHIVSHESTNGRTRISVVDERDGVSLLSFGTVRIAESRRFTSIESEVRFSDLPRLVQRELISLVGNAKIRPADRESPAFREFRLLRAKLAVIDEVTGTHLVNDAGEPRLYARVIDGDEVPSRSRVAMNRYVDVDGTPTVSGVHEVGFLHLKTIFTSVGEPAITPFQATNIASIGCDGWRVKSGNAVYLIPFESRSFHAAYRGVFENGNLVAADFSGERSRPYYARGSATAHIRGRRWVSSATFQKLVAASKSTYVGELPESLRRLSLTKPKEVFGVLDTLAAILPKLLRSGSIEYAFELNSGDTISARFLGKGNTAVSFVLAHRGSFYTLKIFDPMINLSSGNDAEKHGPWAETRTMLYLSDRPTSDLVNFHCAAPANQWLLKELLTGSITTARQGDSLYDRGFMHSDLQENRNTYHGIAYDAGGVMPRIGNALAPVRKPFEVHPAPRTLSDIMEDGERSLPEILREGSADISLIEEILYLMKPPNPQEAKELFYHLYGLEKYRPLCCHLIRHMSGQGAFEHILVLAETCPGAREMLMSIACERASRELYSQYHECVQVGLFYRAIPEEEINLILLSKLRDPNQRETAALAIKLFQDGLGIPLLSEALEYPEIRSSVIHHLRSRVFPPQDRVNPHHTSEKRQELYELLMRHPECRAKTLGLINYLGWGADYEKLRQEALEMLDSTSDETLREELARQIMGELGSFRVGEMVAICNKISGDFLRPFLRAHRVTDSASLAVTRMTMSLHSNRDPSC